MANEISRGPVDDVRGVLEKLKPQFAMALPKHLTVDRLLRVAMTAVQNTPKLLECDRKSLFSAIMSCAQLGLEPDGVLGQAYLVPFKGKVQFIPGYKGLITLARNSGEISSIQAHEVRFGDHFQYEYGLNEKLEHIPGEDADYDDDASITHFYAYARFKDGAFAFEVMTRKQVEKVRDKSEGYRAFREGRVKTTPWADHFAQMGRKTLIRRLSNYLPRNVQRAAEMEAAHERGISSYITAEGDLFLAAPDEGADGVAEAEVIQAPAAAKMDAAAAAKRKTREAKPTAEATGTGAPETTGTGAPKPAAEKPKEQPTAAADQGDDAEEWVADFCKDLGKAQDLDAIDLLVEELGERIKSGEIPDIKAAVAPAIAKRRDKLSEVQDQADEPDPEPKKPATKPVNLFDNDD